MTMHLKKLVNDYYKSFDFNSLRKETKAQYQYFLNVLCDTKIDSGANLGSYKLNDVSSKLAKRAYEQWCGRGVSLANHIVSVARVVYNYAIEMETYNVNPFTNIKKRKSLSRKVVWSKDDVIRFLDTAYSDFSTRNIGLIAQMAYEWCQRLGDMRIIKWSNLDLDKGTMHIEQSKRRAEVFLPISDELIDMLKQQSVEFGFQPYIAPRTKAFKGVYRPYSLHELPKLARIIMDTASLSKELRLSDLRRTGTVEMVDAGVSMGNIMSVTGHANPQSVKPYMKNTLKSASLALNTRRGLTD
jgi:integrase|tara:strand:- start:472 stop:1368 length:897 start_codon:yes stop_codon:yes gene_type:complete